MFPGVLQTEQKHIGKWRKAIELEMNIRQSGTYRRPSGADVQKPIPSALCSSGCKKHKDDRGSSLLSAKMRKTCGDVKLAWESLQTAMKDVCRSSRKNQR